MVTPPLPALGVLQGEPALRNSLPIRTLYPIKFDHRGVLAQ